jgi:hypothetical protein
MDSGGYLDDFGDEGAELVHLLGPHANFGGILALRWAVLVETLTHRTCAVYAFDFLQMAVDQ